MGQIRISAKAASFTESVIREMTRVAMQHGAINLAQGFPDFSCPPELKEAAKAAIDADVNQYAITWGAQRFREAIAANFERFSGVPVDPNRQICVTCGSTEAMIAAALAIVDPGDEVIVFEPFYENYGPDAILSGAVPRYVTLHEPDWTFDEAELAAAFNERTRAIIVNTPNNPTGKVFSREELQFIASLCQKWDVICFTDEIYEHMVYDGREHIPPMTVPGLEDRSVTINAMSKTYSVTGWRIGWTISSPELTDGIRKVHDFLTVGAAAPLQEAGVVALNFPDAYYKSLREEYLERRDLMTGILEDAGFKVYKPSGAYYIMTDISAFGWDGDDVEIAKRLAADPGIATVPGSSFYADPSLGRTKLRFAFCKRLETLQAAAERLAMLRA
ncbi:MAG TPA: aminotransferase class I/II-fold pyridoxal phosphate-dependent enzyme [Actinomycetota bacterium]|nr:aminotransferase class I/II-fold pyridoxal phosphate-dependent enzyme [Actinomycetota bacterium]